MCLPRLALLLVPLLLAALPAAAHDLWLEPTAEGYLVRYGHRAHSGHAGAQEVRYEPGAVKAAQCVAGGAPAAMPVGTAYPVLIQGHCDVAYVLMSTGFWTRTPLGTKNQPKTTVPTPLGAWQSFDSVKRLERWTDEAAQPLGVALEIVPLDNPLAVGVGDKLTVRLLHDGQPMAGRSVSYDDRPRGVTGADGTINVRLRHDGEQTIQASARMPYAGPEADEIVHTTALSFRLGSRP